MAEGCTGVKKRRPNSEANSRVGNRWVLINYDLFDFVQGKAEIVGKLQKRDRLMILNFQIRSYLSEELSAIFFPFSCYALDIFRINKKSGWNSFHRFSFFSSNTKFAKQNG